MLLSGYLVMAKKSKCPQCQQKLIKVEQSADSPLNKYQFESIKAGDWYCPLCPDNNRGNSKFCYWWEFELEDVEDYCI